MHLWIEQATISLFGVHEASLRLPALGTGIAVLVLVAALGLKTGGPWPAALATIFAALSSNLCRYSSEVKPYGIDAAVGCGLLLMAIPVVTGRASPARRGFLTGAGVAGCFLSTPSVFVLAGIAIALWWEEFSRRTTRRYVIWLAIASLTWVAGFLIAYKVFYAPVAHNRFMQEFWAGAVLSFSNPKALAGRFAEGLLVPALGLDDPSIAIMIEGAVLSLAGLYDVYRRAGFRMAALFLIPPGCVVGAAFLGKYFLVARLMMFNAPAVCVLAGVGLWHLANYFPKPLRSRMLCLIAAAAFILPLKYTIWRVRNPEFGSNRELVVQCLSKAQPGDIVYVYPRGVAAWLYYSADLQDKRELERLIPLIERVGPNAGNMPSRGRSVSHEGFDWRLSRSGRVELYGVPTGIQSTMNGFAGLPDPGWAQNEVARMMAEHPQGTLRVFASEYQPDAVDSLLWTMQRDGYSVIRVYRKTKVVLYRMSPR